MNLPCKVVEDLLPMYIDCLCSEESAALVENHLRSCRNCSNILSQLQAKLELEETVVDDLKPLARLGEKWQKSKRSNIKKGICIATAALLLLAALVVGIWYAGYGSYFNSMAVCMEQTPADDAVITDSDYRRNVDGYRFDLWLPVFLGDRGFARVMGENGMGLLIYPEPGGEYSFELYITDQQGRMRLMYLKSDLTPDFDSYDTLLSAEKEKEAVRELVAQKREEITAMLGAVYKLWGINLLEYTQ